MSEFIPSNNKLRIGSTHIHVSQNIYQPLNDYKRKPFDCTVSLDERQELSASSTGKLNKRHEGYVVGKKSYKKEREQIAHGEVQ